MKKCDICPRRCGADRENGVGFCGVKEQFKVAKIMIHRGEEPVISGTRGSGAVFFSGCNLRCVYCQNMQISRGGNGKYFLPEELEKEIFALEEKGVHNIDFITAAHYAVPLARLLERIKPRLKVPIVYNSSGYEDVERLKKLDGLVDVFLPDFKYCSVEAAQKYSSAPDYPSVAVAAIGELVRQRGKAVIEDGLIKSGVIIRHLVLPQMRKDGIEIMRIIAEKFPQALVSVMRQYTPSFNCSDYGELDRKVTSFEYESVVKEAARLSLSGFMQEKGCESSELTPDFDDIY